MFRVSASGKNFSKHDEVVSISTTPSLGALPEAMPEVCAFSRQVITEPAPKSGTYLRSGDFKAGSLLAPRDFSEDERRHNTRTECVSST